MSSSKRIFISHSSKDDKIARIIVEALRGYGFDVWYDEHDLGFGYIRQQLEESLSTCQVFMVLLSQDALQSLWVNREINAALSLEERLEGMLIVPAVIGPCPIPPILRGYRRLNFTADRDPVAELRNFAKIVNQSITHQSLPTPPPWEPTKDAPTTEPNPQASPRSSASSYSIGSISAGTLDLKMGENISITNNYRTSPSPDGEQDLYFSQFTALVDDLSKQAGSNVAATNEQLGFFLEMMATISAKGKKLPPVLIEKVHLVCKQLGVTPLI